MENVLFLVLVLLTPLSFYGIHLSVKYNPWYFLITAGVILYGLLFFMYMLLTGMVRILWAIQ